MSNDFENLLREIAQQNAEVEPSHTPERILSEVRAAVVELTKQTMDNEVSSRRATILAVIAIVIAVASLAFTVVTHYYH